jgi:hypothetical protein
MQVSGRSTRGRDLIDRRFADLASDFAHYLEAYDQRGPFSQGQLHPHLQTIHRRRELGSAEAAAHDPGFGGLLYQTLRAWRLGVRSSKLVPLPLFIEQLERNAANIAALDGVSIDDPVLLTTAVVEQIGQLIASLGIVENKAKLVAGTKALHHLLPDLVPPMDRAWTGRFLGMRAAEWQSPANQTRILVTAFSGLSRVARAVDPQRFVGAGWRSSRTKVLDNALIGFCMVELPGPTGTRRLASRPSSGQMPQQTRTSYRPLAEWLARQTEPALRLTFAEMEGILGRHLPRSARVHRAWWANHSGNSQARAWLSAGRQVDAVDLRAEVVRLGRARA